MNEMSTCELLFKILKDQPARNVMGLALLFYNMYLCWRRFYCECQVLKDVTNVVNHEILLHELWYNDLYYMNNSKPPYNIQYDNSYFNNVLNSSKKLASFFFIILKLCTLCDYIFYVKEGKIFAFLHFHSFPSWWSSRMRIKCSYIGIAKEKISMGKRWMILDSMYLYTQCPSITYIATLS